MKKFLFLFLILALGFAKPKMAVVIDDFGYSSKEARYFASLNYPLNMAVIPGQTYSKACAQEITKSGKHLLIHFPWPPFGKDPETKYPIRIEQGYSTENVIQMLEQAIASVPSANGINNHMGSILSLDQVMLDRFMLVLSGQPEQFYFLDSHTAQGSLARRTAQLHGLPAARNNIFLDGVQTDAAIEKRFAEAVAMAEKNGTVIAICHAERPATKRVLKRLLTKYNSRVEFVFLPEIITAREKK